MSDNEEDNGSPNILLFSSYSDEEDLKMVTEVISRGNFWAVGPEIEEFEREMCNFTGRKFSIAFNSGGSALFSILKANNVEDGEVIVPSFTFVATVSSVIFAGAKPVFADIERDTLALDATDVRKKITENTKAIMPIHFAGAVARDINELVDISKEYNIPLIEDNAHSIGATYNEKMAGTFGQSAILSFAQNKVLATGEGGMVLTDSSKVASRLKQMRSYGLKSSEMLQIGHNFRMPTVLAALGKSQLDKLEYIINRRRTIANYYNRLFENLENLKRFNYPQKNNSVHQIYNLMFDETFRRDDCMKYLKNHGIPSRITYPAVHLGAYFKEHFGTRQGDLPVTEDISSKILTIPLHLSLSDEDIEYIGSKVINFFEINGGRV